MATEARLPAHAIAYEHRAEPSDVPAEEVAVAAGAGRARDDASGLLFAFVATTMVMVGAIAALAVLGPWWWIIPVVLVHWFATYVILARLGALLGEG